jgi:hypothetical protein
MFGGVFYWLHPFLAFSAPGLPAASTIARKCFDLRIVLNSGISIATAPSARSVR